MMDDRVSAELDTLATALAASERSLRRQTWLAAAVYALAFVVVSLSTQSALRQLSEVGTADALTELVGLQLVRVLPRSRLELAAYLNGHSAFYAEWLVDGLLEHGVPELEDRLGAKAERAAERAAAKLAAATTAQLLAEIAAGKVAATSDAALSAGEAARRVSERLAELLAARLAGALDHCLLKPLGSVPGTIDRFEDAEAPLSRKEDAQRRALLNWCLLSAQPGWQEQARQRLLLRLGERLGRQYGPPAPATR